MNTINPNHYETAVATETLDAEEARKLFKAAMRNCPMSRIEVIKVPNGSDIYRVTVVESSWS